ncbi:hypothetical protein TRP8649_01046 [Pelagimonas phthalicica]|uniref:Uncharacterized protein n=1 Tax=Pelagimonas phthalicica TaxID=1037362 RepID=A0A238J9T1_9RHOB|nr:hypothetical protein CLV87_1025 [Pelagimonas phthalicica]SMX26947.1 hypothetical protein TRP8649_01046 [Pelagimonas phthalicica]
MMHGKVHARPEGGLLASATCRYANRIKAQQPFIITPALAAGWA